MSSYSPSSLFLCGALLATLVAPSTLPALYQRDALLIVRDAPLENVTALPPNSIDKPSDLSSNLNTISSAIASNQANITEVVSAYASVLDAIRPAPTPPTVEEIRALVQKEFSKPPTNLIENAASLLLQGLDPGDAKNNVVKRDDGIDSTNNANPRNPPTVIYPKASSMDPSYSISESQLRSAIYIPSTFQYGTGSKQPVILVPGTGTPGGTTYASNFAKLLAGTSFADPLWLNIPGFTLGDIQASAEYVAYAIQYISSITGGKKVGVVTWSQGSLNMQWTMKYWPSTRALVSDHIATSGDYHGTVLADVLCPGFPTLGCDPSVLQQTYKSNFISKLRSNDGDSAYVPTTTIYSTTDEIVQPQIDPWASSFLNDARDVGATNYQVQTLCAGHRAGGFYSHGGVLYHPLAWALTVDALTHDGPGKIDRIDRASVCATVAATGLTVGDVTATEAILLIGAKNGLFYLPKVGTEPAFMPYV
ncbi:MAG: hypothetical protein M1839_009448 [Geoglossum umbratile]|nr:MAG: hypothetical protein M1839_009448 [Geoglossum umbratile]